MGYQFYSLIQAPSKIEEARQVSLLAKCSMLYFSSRMFSVALLYHLVKTSLINLFNKTINVVILTTTTSSNCPKIKKLGKIFFVFEVFLVINNSQYSRTKLLTFRSSSAIVSAIKTDVTVYGNKSTDCKQTDHHH